MRELIAKGFAVFVGVLAVMGALAFATRLNPRVGETPAEGSPAPPGATIVPAAPVDPAAIERGRLLFGQRDCARCHSVATVGNPRSPLDGVGARRTRAELRAWIVAGPSVRTNLGRSVIRTKEGYAAMPPDDLDALTAYLSTLR